LGGCLVGRDYAVLGKLTFGSGGRQSRPDRCCGGYLKKRAAMHHY
jgi:hypothetical protein